MINTKRWNDPIEPDDGTRILITRYRPRALPKADETWSEWQREVAPSCELHAALYGKYESPISWTVYVRRYLTEMRLAKGAIEVLARRVVNGETLTLLCSSSCIREERCHRSLLRELVEAEVARISSLPQEPGDAR